jgi:hypothetical protein
MITLLLCNKQCTVCNIARMHKYLDSHFISSKWKATISEAKTLKCYIKDHFNDPLCVFVNLGCEVIPDGSHVSNSILNDCEGKRGVAR